MDPVIRYCIDLYTDECLLWFAQVETFTEGSPGSACEWTATAETWQEALGLARGRIFDKRKNKA